MVLVPRERAPEEVIAPAVIVFAPRLRAPLEVIAPDEIVPMLTRLPLTSIRLVPAPAPVLTPVVPFRVVPVRVLVKTPVVPVTAPRLAVVEYKLVAVSPVDEAFPRVVCPVTLKVPLAVKDEVAVIVPAVKALMVAVTACRAVVYKLEEVALVKVAFVLVRLVMVVVARVEVPVTPRVVATATLPVKLAALEIVWPLMRPEVRVARVVAPVTARVLPSVVAPVMLVVPATVRREPGVVVPIPTLPVRR